MVLPGVRNGADRRSDSQLQVGAMGLRRWYELVSVHVGYVNDNVRVSCAAYLSVWRMGLH